MNIPEKFTAFRRQRGKLPSKQTVNLAMRENRRLGPGELTAGMVLLVFIVILVAKFAVVDPYSRLFAAEADRDRAQELYGRMETSLERYDEVQDVYQRYSLDWLKTPDTDTDGDGTPDVSSRYVAVNRMDILDLVERDMMPAGAVQSLHITGESLVVEMGGLSLAQCSAMVDTLQAEPMVAGVSFATAESGASVQDVSVAFTLTLCEPGTEG